MKIETKFDINEKVYFLKDSKIVTDIVVGILFNIGKRYNGKDGFLNLYYTIPTYCLQNQIFELTEDKVFKTKEELINSL